MKWPEVRLNDILTLEYGRALRKDARNSAGDVPVAGSNGTDGWHTMALVDGPGIVIGRKGSAGKVTWFDTAFWPIDTTYYVKLKTICGFRWVYYLLNHLQLERLAIVTGVPGLNRNDAYNQRLKLPPLSEQRRIVEILDPADALRKKRAEAVAKAERILPALFYKMFGDPATNPMGWDVGTLEDGGAKVRYGLGQPPSTSPSGIPLIRATNIHKGKISSKDMILVDKSAVPRSRNAFLSAEEVIVVGSGAYTGDVAQVTEDWEGAVAGYDLVITPGQDFCGEFLEAYLLTPHTQNNYFNNLKARAGQPHLNASQLANTPIFFPPKSLQRKFAKRVWDLRQLRQKAENSSEALDSLFNSLMHSAFTGDLTAKWREAHIQELLAEMEEQVKALQLVTKSL
ncbi:MAG: restriction endonuclease subunit S [bacterium]